VGTQRCCALSPRNTAHKSSYMCLLFALGRSPAQMLVLVVCVGCRCGVRVRPRAPLGCSVRGHARRVVHPNHALPFRGRRRPRRGRARGRYCQRGRAMQNPYTVSWRCTA
jgi:hypothetical protein